MDVNDPANLNYVVQGNSGHSARDPHPEWKRWMQIPDAPPETFYTIWFYDWNQANNPTTVRCSFYDVRLSRISEATWQTAFHLISIDGLPDQTRHDYVFTINRPDPMFSSLAASGNREAFASQQTDSKNTLLSVVTTTGIVITALIVLATIGKKIFLRHRRTPK